MHRLHRGAASGAATRCVPRCVARHADRAIRQDGPTRAYGAVLLGRCVPLVRSVVSVPAGFRRMPALPFTLCTAAGSAVWNASLIGAGAVLGERWERARDVVGLLQGAVIVTLLGGFLALLWFRVLRPRFVGSSDPIRPDGGAP
jgi:membrane protein DedA with SNARE-associated domain